MTRRRWDYCPTCGARVLPRNSIGSVATILVIAEHALTQRHQDAMALRRLKEDRHADR